MIKQTLLVIIAFSLSACATATRGTHEVVQINSEPSGARAVSDIPSKGSKDSINGFIGCEPTPCGLNISRRAEPVITVEKEGYKAIKFKVVSSVATSSSSVPTGSIVAGTQNGSHVVAGSPDLLKRIPVGGASIFGGVMTFGAGSILDVATGAGLSLSPNPVTVFFAPEEGSEQIDKETN